MEDKKQTAVEWLEEHMIIGLTYDQQLLFEATFEQAKEMEKEQIMDCFLDVSKELLGDLSQKNLDKLKGASEQYYNETFKSK